MQTIVSTRQEQDQGLANTLSMDYKYIRSDITCSYY